LGTFEKRPRLKKFTIKPTYDTYLQLGVKRSMVSIESLSCYQYQENFILYLHTKFERYRIRFSSHVLCTTLGKKLDIIILKREKGKAATKGLDYGLDG